MPGSCVLKCYHLKQLSAAQVQRHSSIVAKIHSTKAFERDIGTLLPGLLAMLLALSFSWWGANSRVSECKTARTIPTCYIALESIPYGCCYDKHQPSSGSLVRTLHFLNMLSQPRQRYVLWHCRCSVMQRFVNGWSRVLRHLHLIRARVSQNRWSYKPTTGHQLSHMLARDQQFGMPHVRQIGSHGTSSHTRMSLGEEFGWQKGGPFFCLLPLACSSVLFCQSDCSSCVSVPLTALACLFCLCSGFRRLLIRRGEHRASMCSIVDQGLNQLMNAVTQMFAQ